MIELGRGMIFPDSWAYGPPDPPEQPYVECWGCGAWVNVEDDDVCLECGRYVYEVGPDAGE